MKLSTKGRYGIKAMVDIALEYGNGRLSVNQLAEKQGISVAYLEQLIASLKKAGLVDSARGASGGYTLSRAPELISVGEVLRALEGSTAILECVGVDGTECANVCSCSARPLWLKLQKRIDDVLNTTTIKDMADDYSIQLERKSNETSLS
ncbi:MAG: Rrf2 family transcriptional regulator [Clostridiales bacterium]|nr:Rrf2 family transcriptional regulator [Clostridiales bacterium]